MSEESTEEAERDEEQDESSGSDDAEASSEDQDDEEAGSEEQDEESKKAQEQEEEREEAAEKIREMEKEGPPEDIEDWPDDAAKYETFGGPEGEHGYHEGPEEEHLGPSSLRHLEDGGVKIAHEEVDNPDEYKSDPIPGGPTDPDAKQDLTAEKIQEEQGRGDSGGDGDDDSDSEAKSDDDDDSDSDDE
jgi:hypothetical protein